MDEKYREINDVDGFNVAYVLVRGDYTFWDTVNKDTNVAVQIGDSAYFFNPGNGEKFFYDLFNGLKCLVFDFESVKTHEDIVHLRQSLFLESLLLFLCGKQALCWNPHIRCMVASCRSKARDAFRLIGESKFYNSNRPYWLIPDEEIKMNVVKEEIKMSLIFNVPITPDYLFVVNYMDFMTEEPVNIKELSERSSNELSWLGSQIGSGYWKT